jgi:hypothetical protein
VKPRTGSVPSLFASSPAEAGKFSLASGEGADFVSALSLLQGKGIVQRLEAAGLGLRELLTSLAPASHLLPNTFGPWRLLRELSLKQVLERPSLLLLGASYLLASVLPSAAAT